MVLKALGGEDGKGTPESVIEAVRYAQANGAQICNLSFGSSQSTPEFESAIRDSNMLFVVAAGNGNQYEIGYDIDKYPVYPASLPFDNVITVGNLMFNGRLDESSNYGCASVDLAAPGTYILSAIPRQCIRLHERYLHGCPHGYRSRRPSLLRPPRFKPYRYKNRPAFHCS